MNTDLYNFLCQWLSDAKQKRFDDVVSNRTRHIALVAEDIYQSQNTSAILRTAECYGIQDLYIIENTHPFVMNKRIAKGATDWLTLHRFNKDENNSVTCLEELKSKGYSIAVTTPHNADCSLDELSLENKIAVVLGSELNGASDSAIKLADVRVNIPTNGFTESMNVSVTAGIICYSLANRLRKSNMKWELSEEEKLELKIKWAKRSIQSSEKLMELFEKGEMNL